MSNARRKGKWLNRAPWWTRRHEMRKKLWRVPRPKNQTLCQSTRQRWTRPTRQNHSHPSRLQSISKPGSKLTKKCGAQRSLSWKISFRTLGKTGTWAIPAQSHQCSITRRSKSTWTKTSWWRSARRSYQRRWSTKWMPWMSSGRSKSLQMSSPSSWGSVQTNWSISTGKI